MTRDRSNATPPDWDTIARFLADESSAEESAEVRQWLAERPADAELLTALDRTADRVASVPAGDIDVEAALQRVVARRDAPPVRSLATTSRRGGRGAITTPLAAPRWRTNLLRAAAVIAVAAAGGYALWARGGTHDLTDRTSRTYATGIGQQDSVRLPDGSRVLLAPGSELIVAADYGSPRREVELRGEGLFDVRHDDAHAFTVRAGAAVIRDIGTVFTVRVRESRRVRVVVREGAVLLDASRDPAVGNGRGVVLHQGDVGELETGAAAVAQRGGATEDDVAWTVGRLVFRDATLADVTSELRQWYGIELRVDDATLAARHLNLPLEAGDSRTQVVQQIALALGGTVQWSGDTAIVRAGARR